MHSSRMRTIRCSGRQGRVFPGGVCPGGVCPGGLCPVGCLPGWGVSAQRVSDHGGVSAQWVCLPGGICPGGLSAPVNAGIQHPSLVDRILETHLRKHYLSATSFADGKYLHNFHTKYGSWLVHTHLFW